MEEDDKTAVAPLAAGLATKVKTAPSTGSSGLLAATFTASGLANAVRTSADCGVLLAATVKVKPWLSKAPMSSASARPRPRWSVVGMPAPLLPALLAGL